MKKNYNSILKKLMVLFVVAFAGMHLVAQNRIELKSDSKGVQLSKSSLKGFETTFSYAYIESELVETEYGSFSKVTLPETMSQGEIGSPALPVTNKLVAVPYGATPKVKVISYSVEEYNLREYGIERIFPQQPSYGKDTKVEDFVFQYNENAYKTRSYVNAPNVEFDVIGAMRGMQIGSLHVEPLSYNPVNNTIRVYNDIKLEVAFEDADIELTKETLLDSYSPYFNVIYKQMFNSNTIQDVFSEHPDLYEAPVYMLVVANSDFEETIKPWLEWKMQKGFHIDVEYVDSTTPSTEIISYVKQKYGEVKPSFLVIFGDSDKVAPSLDKGQESACVTDLYYGSVDGDYFPDMYYSRMSCSTVSEMEALVNKTLQYEQYAMPDPSYLDNVLMIAGVDAWYTSEVGVPAINYATNFFFNQAHGLNNVYKYISDPYTGCYNHLNTGVGFLNYTAHGVIQGLVDPAFGNGDVANLTNKDKYFWAMGNCCLTGDWGSDICFGEALIRAKEKGAWGYIGACPVTYWNEDYYFTVGATNVFGSMPTKAQTELGFYEAFWMDDVYNTLSSVPFVGNLSVTNANIGKYNLTAGIEPLYYWEAYHALGDGSVMPFRTNPTENTVSHDDKIYLGFNFFTVNANPYSYVGISKDGVLLGASMVGPSGSVDVPITPIVLEGEVKIVVTHPRHIPYMKTINTASAEGPYISWFDISPKEFSVNQENKLTVTYRNVGVDDVEGEAKVTLSSESDLLTFMDNTATFSTLKSGEKIDLTDEFVFVMDKSLNDQDVVIINSKVEYQGNVWENKFTVNVIDPVVNYDGISWEGAFEPGGTYTINAKFKNIGHYKAENTVVTASSTSEYVTMKNTTFNKTAVEVGETADYSFEFTIDENCPFEEKLHFDFSFVADNDVFAEGSTQVFNSCNVLFTLKDTWGDGWAKSKLRVEFSDDTPTDTIEMIDGYDMEVMFNIPTGVTVSVYFIKDKFSFYECSYTIEYEDGTMIYESGKNIKEGLNHEFVVKCTEWDDVEEYENTRFSIYPNPARDVINIKSNVQRYEYQLINSLGQIVVSGVSVSENTIQINNMNKGVYFLKLVADGEVTVNKIMIQ